MEGEQLELAWRSQGEEVESEPGWRSQGGGGAVRTGWEELRLRGRSQGRVGGAKVEGEESGQGGRSQGGVGLPRKNPCPSCLSSFNSYDILCRNSHHPKKSM